MVVVSAPEIRAVSERIIQMHGAAPVDDKYITYSAFNCFFCYIVRNFHANLFQTGVCVSKVFCYQTYFSQRCSQTIVFPDCSIGIESTYSTSITASSPRYFL